MNWTDFQDAFLAVMGQPALWVMAAWFAWAMALSVWNLMRKALAPRAARGNFGERR